MTIAFPFTIIVWLLSITSLHGPWKLGSKLGRIFAIIGCIVLGLSILDIWITVERPPFKTLGETRLWYALILPLVALVTDFRRDMNWLISDALLLASLFLTITLLSPESFDKTLAPALQSPWFIPHVIVYIIAYAILGSASLAALGHILNKGNYIHISSNLIESNVLDRLINIGFGFLTLGLIFGAFWAKEAWGHYWTWDPKETWAAISWLTYLSYIHFRKFNKNSLYACWFLILGFLILLLCWFGMNYLPTASQSVHTYG